MTSQLAARPFGQKNDPGHSRPIAFLGTGRMGGPMAANLARAGWQVRAWDRTASHAAALVPDGVTVAASPAEAVRGAGILITMLADGPATDQVRDALAAAGPGLIWVQMATVGLEWTQRFASTAAKYGVHFFDAPVSGSQGPARAASLTILASGPQERADEVAPVFALKLALKDAELAAQAAQASGTELALTGALLPRWRRAAASGHADDDLAVIYTTP